MRSQKSQTWLATHAQHRSMAQNTEPRNVNKAHELEVTEHTLQTPCLPQKFHTVHLTWTRCPVPASSLSDDVKGENSSWWRRLSEGTSFSRLLPVGLGQKLSNALKLPLKANVWETGRVGLLVRSLDTSKKFSNMWTMNFQMFKLVLEKAEEQEIKLPKSAGSSKKQESSRKTSISALLTMPKRLTVWITINCGKFWKRWECQTTWPASWETYMQVRKQQLELHMEQQTGSK